MKPLTVFLLVFTGSILACTFVAGTASVLLHIPYKQVITQQFMGHYIMFCLCLALLMYQSRKRAIQWRYDFYH
jgi:hypothetical protein